MVRLVSYDAAIFGVAQSCISKYTEQWFPTWGLDPMKPLTWRVMRDNQNVSFAQFLKYLVLAFLFFESCSNKTVLFELLMTDLWWRVTNGHCFALRGRNAKTRLGIRCRSVLCILPLQMCLLFHVIFTWPLQISSLLDVYNNVISCYIHDNSPWESLEK